MGRPRSKRTTDREERLQLALKSWKKQEYPSIRETARQFNVNDVTLRQRVNGGLSIAESCEPQQPVMSILTQRIRIFEYSMFESWICRTIRVHRFVESNP